MKPGYKTTEFWLSVAAIVISAFLASGVVAEGSAVAQALGLALGALSAAGYSVGRSIVKSGDAKASALSSAIKGESPKP
jgi:hypothetical protein